MQSDLPLDIAGELFSQEQVLGRQFRTGPERPTPRDARGQQAAQTLREHPTQSCFMDDDHVIEALSSDGADDALDVGVLPRRPRCRADGLDVHPGGSGGHRRECAIPIVEEIPRGVVLREGAPGLLRNPRCRGMVGHGGMNDPSTVVPEDDQNEQ